MSLLNYVIYSALNWAHYSLSGLVQQILTTISSLGKLAYTSIALAIILFAACLLTIK